MRESTVALLMGQKLHKDETLDAVIARLAGSGSPDPEPAIAPPPPTPPMRADARWSRGAGKYGLSLMGEVLRADTLPKLFRALIDRLAELDTKAVAKIATRRSRKRGFVSREKNAIHPGRLDLPLLQTRSGWWISANIGTDDFVRALKCTCEANNFDYGRDIRFLGTIDC
jgi:hypothetical protein